MNKKLISAVLGTLVLAAPVIARAEDAAASGASGASGEAMAKPHKKAKHHKKHADGASGSAAEASHEKGGEKSCGADGKGCSGKK